MSCSFTGILILLYLLVSIYYLHQASLPIEPCSLGKENDSKSCIKPLLYYFQNYKSSSSSSFSHTNDGNKDSTSTFVLEFLIPKIEVQKQSENGDGVDASKKSRQQPRLVWSKISSCTATPTNSEKNTLDDEMTFEIDNFLAKEYESQDYNLYDNWWHWLQKKKESMSFKSTSRPPKIRYECKLSFPNDVRKRNQNSNLMRAYRGKFILKQIIPRHKQEINMSDEETNNNITISIAETMVDLTRIIQKPMRKNKNQQEYVSHYKYYRQGLVLRLVSDCQNYPINNPVRGDGYKMNHVMLHPHQLLEKNSTSYNYRNYFYRPIFYVDDVALRHNSQIELAPPPTKEDEIKPPVTLNIKLSFMTPMRHAIQRQIELGLYMAEQIMRPNELDELRYLISDEYMYRFIITQIIGFIHLTLDYLAFKNEIGFYVGRGKDVTGISLSSLYSRCICDMIIFLYLLDGGNTSWFVLISIGSSTLVELWKLYKFLQPKWNWNSFPYFISVRDLSSMSSTEQLTINYDSTARTYLSMILYPLVLGMALYGRQFYTYSSWYSWVISNLANAVYTFGFISLCPQLYINYKLKSVAHLPWRVFLYKIFNTFVDDVFAFLIEMPMKHKIMTLRDDVVFFIFLIQAYMYRVDKQRTNEYGYVYENEENDDSAMIGEEKDGLRCMNNKSLKLD